MGVEGLATRWPHSGWGSITVIGILSLLFVALAGAPARARFASESRFSTVGHDDWEPAVAADSAGHVYIATTRYGGPKACGRCPDPAIVLKRSSDGGVSWGKPQFLCRCRGVAGQHDPVLTTDDRGRVFATWMNNFEVNFARSDNFGRTWTRHGALDGPRRYSDKPWIGVSHDGSDVYIAFNSDGRNQGAPYIVHSHNAGRTWSPPVLGHPNTFYWFAGGVTVTPDGAVFTSQDAYKQDNKGQVILYVLRSLDGGRSWTQIGIDRSREPRPCPKWAGCGLGVLGPQIAIASDDNGRVYVLWNASAKDKGPSGLYLKWSDDGGRTWSLQRRVTSAVRLSVDNEYPMLTATGDGDVRIAWMDNRTGHWNTWYRSSTNGGATWSKAQRLSNRAHGAPYKSRKGFGFPYGDYGQIAVDGNGITHAVWGESHSYIGPGGTWYARGT